MHLYPNLPICKMGMNIFSVILKLKRLATIYCDSISDNRSVFDNSELNMKKMEI